jgi:hypothetical protein
MNINLNELKKEIPCKWVISSITRNKDKAMSVPYIDARDVMDLLDEVVGVGNWQNEFYSQGVNTFCKIGIKTNNEWIWKSDTGAISENEPKSLASDSFKRAAVQWGVGRFLYKIDRIWLNYSDSVKKCLDENGKPIYDLTEYCNNLYKSKSKHSAPKRELPQVVENKEYTNSNDKLKELESKINGAKHLKELKAINDKYQQEIVSLGLTNLVSQKRKELYENWFNDFTTNLEKCETSQDIEEIKVKYKWLIENVDYKDLCAKLINEVSKTVR